MCSTAFGESVTVIFFFLRSLFSSSINLFTIPFNTSMFSCLNSTMALNLFLNSGVKKSLSSSFFDSELSLLKPITALAVAPIFDVIISITFWKFALYPLLSVRVALSIIWSKIFTRSGCAFSISSNSKTV